MKKNFVYILLSMIIAATLCACGNTTMNNESGGSGGSNGSSGSMVTSTPSVTTMPTVSPRAEDGIVDDRDGVIQDDAREGGSTAQTSPKIDIDQTEGAEVNTQPTNSAKPTSTAKP